MWQEHCHCQSGSKIHPSLGILHCSGDILWRYGKSGAPTTLVLAVMSCRAVRGDCKGIGIGSYSRKDPNDYGESISGGGGSKADTGGDSKADTGGGGKGHT